MTQNETAQKKITFTELSIPLKTIIIFGWIQLIISIMAFTIGYIVALNT